MSSQESQQLHAHFDLRSIGSPKGAGSPGTISHISPHQLSPTLSPSGKSKNPAVPVVAPPLEPEPHIVDFSRNALEQQDTYMKLINVNTFESEDYGIGLRRSSSQPLKGINSPAKKKQGRGRSQGKEDTQESVVAPVANEEFGRKKLIEVIKQNALRRFPKSNAYQARYKDLCTKYMKNGTELSLNLDIVQRLDVKVFIAIVQDFKKLKFIQLFSEFCSLQQLERKNSLIELPANKQAEMETKKFSQNTGDTLLLVRAFKDNMQENRNLKQIHIIGMKFSREAFTIFGEGIAKAKSLKKLIFNQTNIGQYGLAELALGFSQCSSVEYLDLQCNNLNDSHGYTLAKIISTQFEMRDNLKWKLGLRLPQEIDVSKLGIRYIHLGRNSIGNKGAYQLAQAIKQDAYLRGVNLRKNKIGESGIRELLNATHANSNLLVMDVTHNHSSYEKKQYNLQFRDELLRNLQGTIYNYIDRAAGVNSQPQTPVQASKKLTPGAQFKGPQSYKQSRINYEWLVPELFGIRIKARAESQTSRASLFGKDEKANKKSQFIQFATQIANKLSMQYSEVVRAFIGDNYQSVIGKLRSASSSSINHNHNSSQGSQVRSSRRGQSAPKSHPVQHGQYVVMDEIEGGENSYISPSNFSPSDKRTLDSIQVLPQKSAVSRGGSKKRIQSATNNIAPQKLSLSPKHSVPSLKIAPKASQALRAQQDMAHYIRQLELENNHLKNLMQQRGVFNEQPVQLTNVKNDGVTSGFQQLKNLSYLQRATAGAAVQIQNQSVEYGRRQKNPDLDIIDISLPAGQQKLRRK
ncbi:hypothetical protein FGO68_gene10736 [Halteria grandinella]|uniref:Leucine Rich Repeat family protein n=1 Tax=Halteria grandinella TaxID=5974 RepID=A0A8J8P0Q9_HALGN|nr:hypothetical protein FGO68_gene10736 [Halteria grandinella]